MPVKRICFPAIALVSFPSTCADFFAYACGGWIKNNPIPPDQLWARTPKINIPATRHHNRRGTIRS